MDITPGLIWKSALVLGGVVLLAAFISERSKRAEQVAQAEAKAAAEQADSPWTAPSKRPLKKRYRSFSDLSEEEQQQKRDKLAELLTVPWDRTITDLERVILENISVRTNVSAWDCEMFINGDEKFGGTCTPGGFMGSMLGKTGKEVPGDPENAGYFELCMAWDLSFLMLAETPRERREEFICEIAKMVRWILRECDVDYPELLKGVIVFSGTDFNCTIDFE